MAPVSDATIPGLTPPSARGRSAQQIGDIVVGFGYASPESVDLAIAESRATGRRTGEVLVERGVLTPDQLARVIGERFGVDHVDLNAYHVDMEAAKMLPPSAAKRYNAVPVGLLDERTLLVVMVDPGNVLAIDDISLMTGHEVRPAVAAQEDVAALIGRLNQIDDMVAEETVAEETAPEIVDLRESADDAPVVKLVNSLVAQGVDQGASDIHFEPVAGELAVRFRVDGVLAEATRIPRKLVAGVISRIKIMSELDIAERRIPQDGRTALTIDGRRVDVRVATLPLVGGEGAVLRVLDKDGTVVGLDRLGMVEPERGRFVEAFSRAHGAVLVTGPTGSGKTTTLYGALSQLHTPEKNIITIEDPVEYELAGIKQMQVNPKAGLSFANGLRSMMRADPDIIMVGEIRDKETAQIAVEAALTGHLVLSTPGRAGRRRHPRERLRVRRRAGDRVRARGLRPLPRHRLPGPHRPLRGHAGHRRDPRPHRRAGLGRGDRRGGRPRRHAAAARRGAREGAGRADVVRRAREGNRVTAPRPARVRSRSASRRAAASDG
jgi:type IV pilus assembly protein PilB